jgi:hypothetical protein
MTLGASEWLSRLAAKLGTVPPNSHEEDALLRLAGLAAHTSERTAAPISCWLAARAGVDPAEAERAAQQLVDEIGADT